MIVPHDYDYTVTTVQGDMRDLSVFADESFDDVLQGVSLTFVHDLRQVYREVWRVLRRGGFYAAAHCNPATYPMSFGGSRNRWDGEAAQQIVGRYDGKAHVPR